MRDLLVTAVVFGLLPYVFSRVHWGVYLSAWIGYMNPHRLAYGFAFSMPFAQIIAICTLIGMVMSKEKKRMVWSAEIFVLILLILWMGVSTIFALFPDIAYEKYITVLKIQILTLLTLLVLTSREKVHMFIWVIVLSLGFYGVKGGIFTILTGGGSHVVGPSGSFIEGNNELALALIMTIPLVRYLHLNETNKWVKRGLGVAILLCTVAVVGSQSRGALIGLVAMGFVFWLKSRNKMTTGLLILVAVAIIVPLMPQSWYSRMDTIQTYEEDGSAMQRINAWKLSASVANDRLTGGGFNMYRKSVYEQYAERPEWVFDAHSIYFKMLGEHGYIGLALFLLLLGLTWKKCSNIMRNTRKRADLKWANDLAAMIQATIIGYTSAGAFLGQCYFDYVYHLVAVVVVLGDLVGRALKEPEVVAERAVEVRPSRMSPRRFTARPATPPRSG